MPRDVLRCCESFILKIQKKSDWSGVEEVQSKAAELGGRCVEWLTAAYKDHEKFDLMISAFFALLRDGYTRKIFSEKEIETLRSRAIEQINGFSQDIKDPDLLDFLKYNTSLEHITRDESDCSSKIFI